MRIKRIIAFAVALILIAVGITESQPDSVMAKAVMICLECIGIG